MPTTNEAPNSVALPTSIGDVANPADGGLKSVEAAARLQQFGPNAIPEERPHPVGALLKKFWGVVPWMLELALIIDLFLGKWIEAAVIAALLVSNGVVAFRQESRAREALELLRHRLTVSARVFRDGKWRKVPARELVPGDLVHLRVGDVVPADLRLTAGQIGVDQSQLTGEALSLSLQAQGTAFAGSLLTRGEASAVVTATGARTYFGKTAELVRTAEAPRRVEMLIVKIATYLGAVVVVFAVLAFAAMIMRGTPLSEMLPFGVMLLVASVPVALPMMFSMSAALGARKLAEGGVLVTRSRVSTAINVLEVRLAIEVESAAFAALRRNPSQEASIQEAFFEFERLLRLGQPAGGADFAFHRAIVVATNNPFYVEMLDALGERAIPCDVTTPFSTGLVHNRDFQAVLQREHLAILDAISAGDAERARAAMRRHLAASLQRYGARLHERTAHFAAESAEEQQ